MRKIINPPLDDWEGLLKRPELQRKNLDDSVKSILNEVSEGGDNKVLQLTEKFDGVKINNLRVTEAEVIAAVNSIGENLKTSIKKAFQNIDKFHREFLPETKIIDTSIGISCWRKSLPIDSVGLYIPGGTAPLFSTVLMLAIPAKIAKCNKIFLCSPPNKNGEIHPAILYAANLCGITDIFKVGGAQAIAAMAFGTETIPKAYKIFGPGNQYVTAAKQLVTRTGTAIDMPAGPSEVCVIADETANPEFVAADLLSQAEHGIDSQVICITTSENAANNIEVEINKQILHLPRRAFAEKALENSKIIVVKTIEEAVKMSNIYAPEHLIINCENAKLISEYITNAGSVFIGPLTPESAGDYASGTNHTLPTNGYAKSYSGLGVESFMKQITFQEISKIGILDIGPAIEIMAEEE